MALCDRTTRIIGQTTHISARNVHTDPLFRTNHAPPSPLTLVRAQFYYVTVFAPTSTSTLPHPPDTILPHPPHCTMTLIPPDPLESTFSLASPSTPDFSNPRRSLTFSTYRNHIKMSSPALENITPSVLPTLRGVHTIPPLGGQARNIQLFEI